MEDEMVVGKKEDGKRTRQRKEIKTDTWVFFLSLVMNNSLSPSLSLSYKMNVSLPYTLDKNAVSASVYLLQFVTVYPAH